MKRERKSSKEKMGAANVNENKPIKKEKVAAAAAAEYQHINKIFVISKNSQNYF